MTPRAFRDQLRQLRDGMGETRTAALRIAAERVRDEAKALIGTEDLDWLPLADSTVREKVRLGFVGRVTNTDPLLRTGELRASIQVRELTPDRAVVASDDPIAAYQEFGTERIPPRPFVGVAVFREEHAALADMARVLTDHLRDRPETAEQPQFREAAE